MSGCSNIVYISVGSNMGDRAANCIAGIEILINKYSIRLINKSRFYLTEPVDYKDQDWFVNAVYKIKTKLAPHDLLSVLKKTEKELGRLDSGKKFGPRPLDLDIIFYDNIILNSKDLVIPHPRMHKRKFVLEPLCDINHKMVHPVLQCSVKTLAIKIDNNIKQQVKLY